MNYILDICQPFENNAFGLTWSNTYMLDYTVAPFTNMV